MKLELALAVSCNESGCIVRTIRSDIEVEAHYSSKVRGNIRISPGHLVAIDLSTKPPDIKWRWVPVKVNRLEGDRIIVSDEDFKLISVASVEELDLGIAPGDSGWVCGMPEDKELHDKIIGGKPANPEKLLRYIQPTIEEIYTQ